MKKEFYLLYKDYREPSALERPTSRPQMVFEIVSKSFQIFLWLFSEIHV